MGFFKNLKDVGELGSSALLSKAQELANKNKSPQQETASQSEQQVATQQPSSRRTMYSPEMENLIDMILSNGPLTDQGRGVLVKRAEKEGIDIDELEIYIQSIINQRKKEEEEREIKAEQDSKMGTIRKCPACGSVVQPGAAACPVCGFAFNNIGTGSSSERLNAKLEELNREEMDRKAKTHSNFFGIGTSKYDRDMEIEEQIRQLKMDCIQAFPVPNNREDLMDLLTSIQPKANPKARKDGLPGMFSGSMSNDFGYGYWILFSNCINKAKVSFQNDPDFQSFFDFYEEKAPKKKGFFGF